MTWLNSTLGESVTCGRLRDNNLRKWVDVEVEVHWRRLRVCESMAWTMMNHMVVHRELKRMTSMVWATSHNGNFYSDFLIFYIMVLSRLYPDMCSCLFAPSLPWILDCTWALASYDFGNVRLGSFICGCCFRLILLNPSHYDIGVYP